MDVWTEGEEGLDFVLRITRSMSDGRCTTSILGLLYIIETVLKPRRGMPVLLGEFRDEGETRPLLFRDSSDALERVRESVGPLYSLGGRCDEPAREFGREPPFIRSRVSY